MPAKRRSVNGVSAPAVWLPVPREGRLLDRCSFALRLGPDSGRSADFAAVGYPINLP